MGNTRDLRCPLCAAESEPLLRLEFAGKPPLPDSIRFESCPGCDFVFAGNLDADAYRRFYSGGLNDTGHVSDDDTPQNLYRMQAALLCGHLGPDFRGCCLDFGSGEGQLVGRLAELLPQAQIFGTDLRRSIRPHPRVRFLDDLEVGPARFDLIVLSHVAEHFVDLDDLSRAVARLAPGGRLYVEVPDPLGYDDCPRREFLYYFDRLHVNHFSRRSLTRWLESHSLGVDAFGTHRFAYRDGLYPAQYAVASSGGASTAPPGMPAKTVRVAVGEYRDAEMRRAAALRGSIQELGRTRHILVYGRGDNYFRALSPGGPLHDVPIRAVLDRNPLHHSRQSSPPVLPPLETLAADPDAAVVLTVSAGAEDIARDIRAARPERIIVTI